MGRHVHRVSRRDARAASPAIESWTSAAVKASPKWRSGGSTSPSFVWSASTWCPSKVAAARQETIAHNQRVGFAAADACRLPFKDGVFDSIYCVAVLQHIDEVDTAVREFARVTAPRGRVLAVEPDNSARYGFSSTPMGRRAIRVVGAVLHCPRRGTRRSARRLVPTSPSCSRDTESSRSRSGCFRFRETWLGPPDASVWQARRAAVETALRSARSDAAAWLGREYLDVLTSYEREANEAGSSFVEIQNTMLFATVGQKLVRVAEIQNAEFRIQTAQTVSAFCILNSELHGRPRGLGRLRAVL